MIIERPDGKKYRKITIGEDGSGNEKVINEFKPRKDKKEEDDEEEVKVVRMVIDGKSISDDGGAPEQLKKFIEAMLSDLDDDEDDEKDIHAIIGHATPDEFTDLVNRQLRMENKKDVNNYMVLCNDVKFSESSFLFTMHTIESMYFDNRIKDVVGPVKRYMDKDFDSKKNEPLHVEDSDGNPTIFRKFKCGKREFILITFKEKDNDEEDLAEVVIKGIKYFYKRMLKRSLFVIENVEENDKFLIPMDDDTQEGLESLAGGKDNDLYCLSFVTHVGKTILENAPVSKIKTENLIINAFIDGMFKRVFTLRLEDFHTNYRQIENYLKNYKKDKEE